MVTELIGKKEPDQQEHILACLSSSPSNAHIILCAANMAKAFHGKLTALYVENPSGGQLSEADQKRLQDHMELARKNGAQIEKIIGEDVPYQIAEYARLSRVTKIVIGRSAVQKKMAFWKSSLVDKLLYYAPNMDIHIIPDSDFLKKPYQVPKLQKTQKNNGKDLLISIFMLFLATVLGLFFSHVGLSDANIITLYILSVLLISVMTTNYMYCFLASFLAVIVFNFMFTDPKYTLLAYDAGYPVTFVIMFIVSFIAGNLASRLKQSAKENAEAAYRTKLLFDTEQLLAKVHGTDEVTAITAKQLLKLLNKTIILYLEQDGDLSEARIFAAPQDKNTARYMLGVERGAALWVRKNRQIAGYSTKYFSQACCQYFPIAMDQEVFGVLGIAMNKETFDAMENSIILSILGECALDLENEKNAREKEEANLQAHKEQTRANLIRAISHDLRTPLTTISGNASNLMNSVGEFEEEVKQQIYSDIYDDSMWLNSLVDNLLSISRIEDGSMQLHPSTELLEECVQEALKHIDRKGTEHKITAEYPDEMILVNVEARLIVQLVINLVNNAIKYTQKGSEIQVRIYRKEELAYIEVADNGPGISKEDRDHIFEMFYTSGQNVADSRRSLGLGLSLCKSIVQAHGGSIYAKDRKPCGTVFVCAFPVENMNLQE